MLAWLSRPSWLSPGAGWCAFYLHPDFIMLRRGPSLPFNSPHAPVRVRVRASACVLVPAHTSAGACPPVPGGARVPSCARLCVAACVGGRACARLPSRVPASRACASLLACSRVRLRMLASRVRPVLTLPSLAGLTVPGCGGRRSTTGLSSGLHPRRYRLSPACSAVSFLYLVQSYCGGSSSRVLAVPLEAVLGP